LADQAVDRWITTFCKLYPEGTKPSIPPEQLLLALLLQSIYGIRSERMLIEEIDTTCCSDGLSASSPTIRSGTRQRMASGRLRLHQKRDRI
jgi:transposase